MYGKPDYDPIQDAYHCEACFANGENCWSENLSFHVWRKHQISIREYNLTYGFDKSRRWVSERSRRVRRENVYRSGINANIKRGLNLFTKGNQVGKFKRSAMSVIRLRTIGGLPKRRKLNAKENKEDRN